MQKICQKNVLLCITSANSGIKRKKKRGIEFISHTDLRGQLYPFSSSVKQSYPKIRYCFIMLASYVLQAVLQTSAQPIPSLCSKRSPPTCKPSSIWLSPSGRTTGFAAFIFQCNKMTLEWMHHGYYQYTIFHCLQINLSIIFF